MAIDVSADIGRLLRGREAHLQAIATAVFDALDPDATVEESGAAIDRIIGTNPTVGLLFVISLLAAFDAAVSHAIGGRRGDLIAEMRRQCPEQLKGILGEDW
jgi:hypothetical protein